MDGISFLRSAAENGYNGAVILLSGVDKGVMKAAECLVKAYGLLLLGALTKPLAERELLLAISRHAFNPTEYQRLAKIAVLSLSELQSGLADNCIELVYQPKIALSTQRIIGAECLARWRHPERGLLGPAAFISVIEAHGLIDNLTKIVLHKSASQLRKWYTQGHQLKLSVNVSMDNLNQLDLPEEFEAIVQAVGVRPSQLILELTVLTPTEN